MSKFFGIEFAPLFIPWERRLQTASVLFYVFCCVISPVFFILLLVALLFTQYYWITIGYTTWYVYDQFYLKTPKRGGRRWKWLRSAPHVYYFRDYFPMEMIKTADLDPSKNYIFGTHPHGIICCSMFLNFATEATGFSEKYPGILPHLLTLTGNIMVPVIRSYIMMMGSCDVSKESIEWILTKQGVGNAVMIVVGGAEEALEARPGTYNIALKNRKGFVKLAVKHGASLVPVYSFGENDLYDQMNNPHGSKIRKFQEIFKKLTGFSPPIFHGRGVFNYTFGILPYRKPVHTVVGRPIDVPKHETAPQEIVDEVHAKYLQSLSDLFDEYKTKFGIHEDKKMIFI